MRPFLVDINAVCLFLELQVGIRQSSQIPPDLRAYAQALLTSMPSQLLIPYIYPNFYSLHNMPAEVRAGRLITTKVITYEIPMT